MEYQRNRTHEGNGIYLRKLPCRTTVPIFIITGFILLFGGSAASQTLPDSRDSLKVEFIPGIDSVEVDKFRLNGFPVIAYTPETSMIFGGGASLAFRNPGENMQDRPDNIQVIGLYTLENQAIVNGNAGFYLNGDEWELTINLAFQRFPDSFFGVENRTSIDAAQIFTTKDFLIQPWLLKKVFKDLRVGIWYDLKQTRVLSIEEKPGGPFDSDHLLGADSAFLSGLGSVLAWDNRDNIFFPTGGGWYRIENAFYGDRTGSEYTYQYYSTDLSKIFLLHNVTFWLSS